jgi:probable phosphomutase (TIGR03848 family)
MPLCLLVRHGHSTANETGTLAGWTDGVGLSERGRDQAKALGALLADLSVVRLVTSPLLRCWQTAEAIAEGQASDPGIAVDEGLGECRYGAWTGRALEGLADEPLWRTVQDVPSQARFPDSEAYAGESLAEMAHRVVSAVRRIDAEVAAQHGPASVWVAVSHGDPIKAVVAEAAGAHLDSFQRIAVDPGSVSVVVYSTRRPAVLGLNLVGGDLRRFAPGPEAPLLEEPDAEAPGAGQTGPLPGDGVVGGGPGGPPAVA